MSAQVLASALFPPSGDQIWNDELLWQPIPVHTGFSHILTLFTDSL